MSSRASPAPRSSAPSSHHLPSQDFTSPHSLSYPLDDKPGQPSRPRAASRAATSPVIRPVRSAPASPSGRIFPAGLVPLSPISPIHLGVSLPERSKSGEWWGQRGAGGAEVGDQRHWGEKGASADGFTSSSRPVPIPITQARVPSHSNSTSPPKPLPRSSSYGNSLNFIPQPLRSRPIKSPQPLPDPNAIPSSLPRTSSRPLVVKSRSRSRPLAPSLSSGSDTETGEQSDTTVRPGRLKAQSLSQPDLVALRNRLEGWVGDVAARQSAGRREKSGGNASALGLGEGWLAAREGGKVEGHARRTSTGRKTPPDRRHSGQAGRLSPRNSSGDISPLTPVSSLSSRSLNSSPRMRPVGGMTSSEDADDDFDSTDSPSSGSLSFSPKRRELRRRLPLRERLSDPARSSGGLGLVFTDEPEPEPPSGKDAAEALKEENLFSLRLLAVFPAVWGYLVLMQAVMTGGIWVNLYPWGIDTSREALDRVIMGWGMEGTWGKVPRGDLLLAAAWAVLTGHYCFDMTTGLTHRWRVYYDLPATITRLLSIQCICWPLTGLTLWILGPERILFAWVVIGCTTAASRSVQMYVTSNILAALPGQNGDVTPRRKSSVPLPARGRSPRSRPLEASAEKDSPEEGMAGGAGGWLEQFKVDRRWDWDLVAREVGWKLGVLLLLTNAWLFWGIETGRFG